MLIFVRFCLAVGLRSALVSSFVKFVEIDMKTLLISSIFVSILDLAFFGIPYVLVVDVRTLKFVIQCFGSHRISLQAELGAQLLLDDCPSTFVDLCTLPC